MNAGAFIREALRLIVAWRGTAPYLLRPSAQLARTRPVPFARWRSTGTDAHYRVLTRGLGPGWHACVVRTRLYTRAETCARLRFDYGEGFGEGDCVEIDAHGSLTSLRVFRIPRRARAMRFEPMDQAGEFRLDLFLLFRVSERYAVDLQIRERDSLGASLGNAGRIDVVEPRSIGSARPGSRSRTVPLEHTEPAPHGPVGGIDTGLLEARVESEDGALGVSVGTFMREALKLTVAWRGTIPYLLRPSAKLARTRPVPFARWRADGTEAHFRVLTPGLRPGWHACVLRIRLHARTETRARLRFDFGDGFDERHYIEIGVHSSLTCLRAFRIPRPTRAIRFEPIDHPGEFQLYLFLLFRVSERYAVGLDAHDGASRCASLGYADWIRTVEPRRLESALTRWRSLTAPAERIVFSVVVPVYETDPGLLGSCVDSVIGQSYPDWELCLADDASSSPELIECFEALARRDARIRTTRRHTRGHISEATNSALGLASGEFVVFLDHDDTLAPDALIHFALAVAKNPDAQILYSDEDKLDAFGERIEPHFKSDWNPDLFYSQNFLSHLTAIRRNLIVEVGGMREEFEGSQDYDLLLRCIERVSPEQVVHIPCVLYHWREVRDSTAVGAGKKDYAHEAGERALREHFDRLGEKVEILPGRKSTTYRVKWPIPDSPLVSLIVPTRDNASMLRTCVGGLLERTDYRRIEVIIVDNGSRERQTREVLDELASRDGVTCLSYPGPFNFSAINNHAVACANGDIVGLINDDIEPLDAGWLDEMVSHAVRPDVGCVGAKLYYPDGTIQHGGVICGIGGVAGHSHKRFPGQSVGYYDRLQLVQNLSAVTGACLLVRKSVYLEVGRLDERELTIAFNDVDFCLRVRKAGYRNLWTPYARLLHWESYSRGPEDSRRKRQRFAAEVGVMRRRWQDVIRRDPYYNPNLTLKREDFSIGT